MRKNATTDFRTLLISIAQDPGMLSFLDAGKNIKGAPNENFAREIMELFSMGVGNYSEKDIREAARAFTGWNYENLKFVDLSNNSLKLLGSNDRVERLKKTLNRLIEKENYESAAIIRDRIDKILKK